MTAKRTDLVIGVFDHPTQAEQALADLRRAGFPKDHLDLATVNPVAGALEKRVSVPDVGEVLEDGYLSTTFADAALPAGSYFALFVALELSEDDARYYAEALGAGRAVVLARTPDRQAEVHAVLNRHAAHDRGSQRPDGSYL